MKLKFALVLAVVIMTMSTARAQFPNLIYYKFDEGTGVGGTTLNEASPGVGTMNSVVNNHSLDAGVGQFSGGLSCAPTAATTNFVDTGWPTNFGMSSWTISFWLDTTGQSGTALSYCFGDSGASSFRCFTNGVAGTGNIALRGAVADTYLPGGATGGPHVITWVYDATVPEVRGYLDGVLGITTAQAQLNITTGTGLRVGGYNTSSFQPGCVIDEFRVYDYALTQAEITATYNVTLFDQNILDVTQTPGLGDLNLSLTNLSPTATQGFLFLSSETGAASGTGSFFGIEPSPLTFAFLNQPMFDGNPFNFPVPSAFGLFPNTPLNLGSGAVSSLNGQTFDWVIVLFGPGFSYDSKSNVVRHTFM